MIEKAELLMGRDQQYPNDYTPTISSNLDAFLVPLNGIRAAWGKPMIVVSGWRPPEVNAGCGGAPHSKHMEGLAADIQDVGGNLWAWVMQNLGLMQKLNIAMENKCWTPTWVHFQLGTPSSGHRIFVPNQSPAPAPNAWDQKYDPAFDGPAA